MKKHAILNLILWALALYFLFAQSTTSIPSIQATGGGVLNFATPTQAELANQETHHWLFSGHRGQMITLSVERFPADQDTYFDPVLELYAPDGTLLVSDDNGGPWIDALLVGYVLPTDGLYTIQVKSADGWSAGPYQITLVENQLPIGCTSPNGTLIEHDWYDSPIAREQLRYRVYLPPCYQASGRRYPYVILMHGSNTSDTHWDRLGIDEAITRGVALGRIPPVAIVMPFGGVIANTNTFKENASYEYVILNEIMPTVESSYCLAKDAPYRAIGGISRGGFWAFLIGMRNPSLFSAIGGHSPFFDEWNAPATHNPLNLATTVTWSDTSPHIYIDRGKNDYAQLNIDLMVKRLTEHTIPHTFVLHPQGQHRDEYWAAHLDEYLAFYTAQWSSGLATLSFCDIPNGGLPTPTTE